MLRRIRRGASVAAVGGALLALFGTLLVAAPATAAGETAVLQIDKSVNKTSLAPNDTLNYTIDINCLSDNCVGAQLVDTLPPQFDVLTLNPTVTVSGGTATYSWGGTNNRTLTMNFTKVAPAGSGTAGAGIPAGDGPSVSISLAVPNTIPADWPYNGVDVTNTATVSATTAATVSDTATTKVTIPYTVATTASAVWAPTSAQFSVGALSTLTLSTRNTSNATASTLQLLAPTDVTAGSNLFESIDFSSFGAVVFPAGADQIQVDAYAGGAWTNGTPAATASLPAGVVASTVTGLRITFSSSTGITLTANGSAGSIALVLAQRASTRTAHIGLVSGATITANVTGLVTVPGQPSASAAASATYAIGALTTAVTGTTTFTGSRIPAGTGSVVTITGKNTSNGPLTSLVITQPVTSTLLSSKIVFDGFRGTGYAWPAGATLATLTWFVDSGTAPASSTYISTDTLPTTPPTLTGGQQITGFSITYTGTIAVGSTAGVPFHITVAQDAVPAVPGTGTFTNQVRVDGSNDAGAATPATPSAVLTVLAPQISVALTKTTTPGTLAVPAGGRSVVQLRGTTGSDVGLVTPTSIDLSDVMGAAADDYWNAFDLQGVAPTQVAAGSTLVVSYTTDGTTWVSLPAFSPGATAAWYQPTIPAPATVIGVKFGYTNASGFAQSTTVQGNLMFVARATLRTSGTPTSTLATPGVYTNTATVLAKGDVLVAGVPVQASSTATALGRIKSLPPGSGGLLLSKSFTTGTVPSQSGLTRVARVMWGSELPGYPTAVITDVPTPDTTPVAQSIYQAFNLTNVPAITTAIDPSIKYDQLSNVELYNGTAWVSIYTTVCATVANCQGKTPVINLSAAQQNSTLGIRFTFAEFAAGRAADPLAPPVGSGVASGPDPRRLDLTYQVRNVLRDTTATPTNPWVTATRIYNDVSAGSVRNDVSLAMGAFTGSASGSIVIIDPTPSLTFAKTALNAAGAPQIGPVAIPANGDVLPGVYPIVKFSMAATNSSTARAWYMRVTDQMPCAVASDCVNASTPTTGGWTIDPYAGKTWDPATNPFEDFTIEKVSYTLSANSGISTTLSTVTLWKTDGTSVTVTGLGNAQLSDPVFLSQFVGASALFASTSTAGGGTIANGAVATLVLDTRLRATTRSTAGNPTPTPVTPRTVTNSAFSQLWDGVLDDHAAWATRSATVTLADASIDIAVAKSFSTPSILEANRNADITVTLTANQGASTASTREVTVSDIRPEFWNQFDLRSLTSASMPAGADQVRADVQLNGGSTWTLGAVSASTPALPAVTLNQVTGIRLVFWKADGSLFSVTAPGANWNTSILFVVRLRAALRDTGGPIPFTSTVPNTVIGTTKHDDDNLKSKSATVNATIALDPGTFKVDVEKRTPVKTTPAGETIDWSLIFTNTGTGYLDNPVVVDQLPIDATLPAGSPLLFDPTSEVTFATSAGGVLPTTTATVSYDDTTRRITFTWPAGSRLAPGEKYTITVPLQVAPGLQSTYGDVTNFMTFTSDRTLAACTNTSGNGEGVSTVGATGCRTSNDLTTVSASAISSFKGVKGDVDAGGNSTSGAVNVNNAATACVADSQGYYRNPCAANTVIGGTDLWKIQFTNGGNVPAQTASIVDVLPVTGDKYLASGTGRGTTYRPIFAGGVTLATDALSAGASYTWEYTTAANPCPNFTTNATCSTVTWSPSASLSPAAYATVTGIRITFSFAGIASHNLPPGATLAIGYRTVNTPSTSAGDGRAPVTVPVSSQRAWNSFGVYATFGSGYSDRRVEPVRAGVQLATGPIQVGKVITGAAAAYAPTSFSATASCTVAGVPVVLPASGALTLAAANATPYTTRLDGIPVGSICRVVENTAGANSVTYSPLAGGSPAAGVTVATAADSSTPVPAAQIATITNDYETTTLTVTKQVTTTATVGAFGPFTFALACTAVTGSGTLTVPLAAGDAAFTLNDGDTHTIAGLPVTATCDLTETDSSGASRIGVTLDGGPSTTVSQGQARTLVLGTNAEYDAVVTNTYDGGKLAVSKTLAGAGSVDYGSGPFTVAAHCDYGTQVLYDGTFSITGGQTVTLAPVFPVGTQCAVNETDAGGATTAATGSTVLIPAPTGVQTVGLVTVGLTNRFDTGTLFVSKARTGAVAAYGSGPFQAQVVCTWTKGATLMTIPLPAGGLIDLTSANAYSGTVTGLIAGASCAVTETKTGAATTSTASGPVTIVAGVQGGAVIANDFATGSLVIDKVRDGEGVTAFGAGPFTVHVDCGYDKDGTRTAVDLGADADQALTAANGYHAKIDGILAGADCTVTETDMGLAVSNSLSPANGKVTIVAAGGTDARVVVTNTFLIGALAIQKTSSQAVVQGGDDYDYTLSVSNVGHVDAAGVKVVDTLDATLHVVSIASAGWDSCVVTGAVGGYGGTLTCQLNNATNPVLGVAAAAPPIVLTVEVLPDIAQDTIDNCGDVTSTTATVSGDRDCVSVDVKWLAVTATPQCVQDAPWLDYTVDAHNVAVAGRTMTVDWLDSSGTVIHTDSVAVTANGTISGRLLWPGATVDSSGNGIGWPGWRPALPGETPDWENLVLDPAAYGYGLRSGASVRIHINPTTTVHVTYPPSTALCGEAPDGRDSDLWITKVASVHSLKAGDRFSYLIRMGNNGMGAVDDLVMTDPIPTELKVLSVTPAVPASGDVPAWTSCVVTARLANGYGGTLTCTLDRSLAGGGTTPDVELAVRLSPSAPAGSLLNTAQVTATEGLSATAAAAAKAGGNPPRTTLARQSSALVLSAGNLAMTGATPQFALQLGLALLALGVLMAVGKPRRRRA